MALDLRAAGWDRRRVPALTLRPAPLDRVAALRALPAALVAVAGGAWLALVVAVVFGGDLGSAQTLWIGVAGACACASGVIVGSTGNVTWAAALAVVAVAAVVLAAAGGGEARGTAVAPFEHADLAPNTRDHATAPARSRVGSGAETASPADTKTASPADTKTASPADTKTASPAGAEIAPPADLETPSAGAETPSLPAGALSVSAATQVVRSYYAALDAGDFAAAWARLSPSVQAAFGGFDHWRAGYATTAGHEVADVVVDGNTIQHTLVATDRTPCGTTVERRFRVTWTMAQDRAESLHAVKLAGQDPAAAC